MKERLTGAIILVALIVLLVPELLTGPIRTRSAPAASSAATPAPVAGAEHPQAPLRSYTLTLGAPPPAQEPATPAATVPVQPAQTPQRPAAGPADPKESDADRSTTDGSVAARPALQAAKLAAHSPLREARSSASSKGWVVQLGSFASRQNADRLAHSLAGRGFRMSVSPARAGSHVLWRVRTGPAHDRAAAERLAARLRALGHRGELLPVK